MADGYTKLFSDIVDSSIWDEDAEVCKVWVTLLALCNADGLVRGSVGWLAAKSRVTNDRCEMALLKFESPDAKSRTPDNDGRRIERLDDGWLILNYLMFRDRLSTNPVAVKTRERVKRHRERYKALQGVTGVTPSHSASASASVSDSEVPSWKEFWEFCQSPQCGIAAEWFAKDKFLAVDDWTKKQDWRKYALRIRGWWDNDGRPIHPPKRKNAINELAQQNGNL